MYKIIGHYIWTSVCAVCINDHAVYEAVYNYGLYGVCVCVVEVVVYI